MAHRRMREESFRRSQEEGLRLAHIAPLNSLVDDLRTEGRGFVPYLAPMYGGVEAEMLAILRDPGPMTDSRERGSGFLCLENDDPAAELYASLLDEAGIAPSRMVAWNAYPWYINRKPTSAELAIGVGPLKRLLDRLPRLRVVLLHGGDAQAMWLKFAASYPHMADAQRVLRTYHTSRQAFIGTKDVRDARMADLRETFATAARILG